MPRRLPTFGPLALAAAVGLFALASGLTAQPPQTGDKVNRLLVEDAKLVAALRDILRTLQTEDEATKLKREILELEALKKEVERIKRAEENIRARTEQQKGDPNKIAKDQNDLAN